MEKQHATTCASKKHKYHGDMRNEKEYANIMLECDCDGYHTFTELYDHRIELFIALCNVLMAGGFQKNPLVWRSEQHHVGGSPMYEGWFVMGINKEAGTQMSYHLPMSRWDDTDFAITLENAPEWDGHTPHDVIERLKKL